MKFLITISLTILSAIGFCSGGKVLFYMPFISESVKITFMPVAKELASRGHSVTIVTPFPDKKIDSSSIQQISFDSQFMVDSIREMSKSKLNPNADASFPIFDLFNMAFIVSQ
jgi:hypothetical protein